VVKRIESSAIAPLLINFWRKKMILTIELSEEAWQKLQAHSDACGVTVSELLEQCSLNLEESGSDRFMNIVSLANAMAYAMAENKYNHFRSAMQVIWGASDRLSELTEELEEEFAEG
jgi:hypothetical protein